MTTTLAPELNTALPASSPALLVEHVTKRFTVDRRKPPVLAIDDVSLRLERGTIHGWRCSATTSSATSSP
jgi:ABC-type glutathione transport system ATPase component